MKNIFKILLSAMILFLSQNAMAAGECDKYTSSYDKTYCFSKLFLESDKELNSVYKELRSTVTGTTREQLTEVQRKWIQYRDQTCQPRAGAINVDCNYQVNRSRTEYLRDRLRECKAVACRPDLITSKSWD